MLQGSNAGGVPVNALRSCAPELPECKVTTRGMEDEQSIEGSDKSFTRSWKFLKDAVRKRLEPKSRRTSLGSSPGSVTEGAADASQITRSSSSAVKQRMAKGPLSALYKPKPFKAPRYKNMPINGRLLGSPFIHPVSSIGLLMQYKDFA